MSETPNWDQADDDDMQGIADQEQGDNTIGPVLDNNAQFALGYSQGVGLNITQITQKDLQRLAQEINAQHGGRRHYNPGLHIIQAQADELAQNKRREEAEEERKQTLAAVALELAKLGVDSDVTAPYTPGMVAAAPDGSRALGTLAIGLVACPVCGKWMVEPGVAYHGRFYDEHGIGVTGLHNGTGTQVERAGWVVRSDASVGGHAICVDCKAAGHAVFTCCNCKKDRSVTDLKLSIGDYNPDQLCIPCYNKVPAAAWDRMVEELEEEHRYDNE